MLHLRFVRRCFPVCLTALFAAPTSLARDTFRGVTNAPRPSEFLLWDADTVAGI